MNPFQTFWRRLRSFGKRGVVKREIDDELRFHIEQRTVENIAAGMSPESAAREARRRFGNVQSVREECRDVRGASFGETLLQDIRFGARILRKNPGFTLVAAFTLALGIGGTTAVFSVVQAVLLAPLPYEHPGRLVRFYQQEPGNPSSRSFLTGVHFKELRDHAGSFEGIAGLLTYSETGLDLFKDERAQRLRVLQITSGYFRTLRSGPVRGREFDFEDEGAARRIILSDRLWQMSFGRDPSIVGTTVQLSGESYEVVGIAPAGFEDPIAGKVDAWIPYPLATEAFEQNYALTAIGRLRKGVNLEHAQAELAVLSRSLAERWPDTRASSVVSVPLQEDLVAPSRGPLFLVLIAVGIVLLVTCVNVANLTLVRATDRVHEFAVRAALGSGRGRLTRQLLVESVMLAGLGGLLGVVLAKWGIRILQALGRDAIPRLDEVGFDPTVLGFAAMVTFATAIAFGVAPALRFARANPNHALRQQSRSTAGARGQGRIRSALAITQIALALTLLVGAGALWSSFHRLQRVDLGFRSERTLTFEVSLPTVRYDVNRRIAFQEELAQRLETIPGVTAAGGISRLPATGSFHPWGTRIDSGPLAGTFISRRNGFNIQQRTVSGNVFAALKIPVLAGRIFDARDDATAPARAVVSANFAHQAFPGMPFDLVIGQRIATLGDDREIIGVVGDVKLDVYGASALVVYHAHRQFAANRNWALVQVVATELPPDRILAAVRTKVTDMDPELVMHHAALMTEVVGRGIRRERFALVLFGAFAGVSLMLAALGLYGVLAYTVRHRTQEIGIRMALGATAAHIRALILRQAVFILGTGLLLGMAGAMVLGRCLSSLLFEISPSSPGILLSSALLLAITGLLASWLPAWRASRMEPGIAMKEE